MRNQTDLMRAILTSETAKKIIDYVSPIYGNSYVGLWLFQAIGTALDDVVQISEDLKYEGNPATATILLDLWEDHYRLERSPHLTPEQRRFRLITKLLTKGPCNPARLADSVSTAYGGADVEIIENVAPNTFFVGIHGDIDSLDVAKKLIDKRKPAHLICDLAMVQDETADIKAAVAVTYSETYTFDARKGIYVDGETLVADVSGVSVNEETFVLPRGIAYVDGETLIIK